MKTVTVFEYAPLNLKVTAYIYKDAEVVPFDTSLRQPPNVELFISDSLLHMEIDGGVVDVLRDGFTELNKKYAGDFISWYSDWTEY